MKTLGVLGGLGPMATAYFMQLLTRMTDARTDQEHMEIVLYSKPSIPDRTKYILGESPVSPVPEMAAAGVKLREMGADLLAMPCITAHYFHRELEERTGLPIINAIDETVLCLEDGNVKRAGLLATDGTIQSGLFQRAFEQKGITPILPSPDAQRDVMDLIYRQIKSGKEADMALFGRVSRELRDRGAEVILLACTELSLIKRDHPLGRGYLDVMEVLARRAVQMCSRLREEYQDADECFGLSDTDGRENAGQDGVF